MNKYYVKLLAAIITFGVMFLTTIVIELRSISELSTMGAVLFSLQLVVTYFITTLILKKMLNKH